MKAIDISQHPLAVKLQVWYTRRVRPEGGRWRRRRSGGRRLGRQAQPLTGLRRAPTELPDASWVHGGRYRYSHRGASPGIKPVQLPAACTAGANTWEAVSRARLTRCRPAPPARRPHLPLNTTAAGKAVMVRGAYRLMIMRITSLVPSRIECTRRSRITLSTG